MVTLRVTEGPAHTRQERLYFLDWLRVLAVLCVFFFHTLHPFDFLADWNVKNADGSLVSMCCINQ